MANQPSSPDFLIDIKTMKSVVIKNLFESIKFCKEANVVFDPTGITISTFDYTNTIVVYMHLEASKFESYYCKTTRKLGINLVTFYKLIKSVNIHETICLYLSSNQPNELGIIIDNSFKNVNKLFMLPLLEIDREVVELPSVDFDFIISIPSSDFQQYIKDFEILDAQHIEVQCVGKKLILSNCDGTAKQTTQIVAFRNDEEKQKAANEENINTIDFIESSKNEIVQGIFKLHFLSNFLKASHLSPSIQLYLKNDHPIKLEVFVSDMGILQLYIGEKNFENDG